MGGNDKCSSLARKPLKALMIDDSIIVPGLEDSRLLYSCGFYGQPIGVEKPRGADFEAPLKLSLVEALYLASKGFIKILKPDGTELALNELEKMLDSTPKYRGLYEVYKSLRDKGLVVRSGLKFGADFTVYRLGPGLEHAPFIVHVEDPDRPLDPTYIVRAGRLGHSVRKKFVIAFKKGDNINYLLFNWYRP